MSAGSRYVRKVRGMVWAEDGEPEEDAGSNLLRKEDTFPVTTGEGDLLRRLSLVPVPDLPRAKGEWTSQCSELVMEKVRFLAAVSGAGLGLRVVREEKGVVPRDLVGVLLLLSRDFPSNLSLALDTQPWLAAG